MERKDLDTLQNTTKRLLDICYYCSPLKPLEIGLHILQLSQHYSPPVSYQNSSLISVDSISPLFFQSEVPKSPTLQQKKTTINHVHVVMINGLLSCTKFCPSYFLSCGKIPEPAAPYVVSMGLDVFVLLALLIVIYISVSCLLLGMRALSASCIICLSYCLHPRLLLLLNLPIVIDY